MKRCYIAGPMTGYPGLNFDAFHQAAKMLREASYEVVNPAEINPALDANWTECMLEDIKQLSECNTIYLLKGWEDSYGARIEHLVAQKLGITVVFQPSCPIYEEAA